MSNLWSWFIIAGTVVSLIACFWLVAYANKQRASDEEIAESESHVWDEDVRELNNPLPMWWLWLFVGTIIWSGAYLIYYPGLGGFGGVGDWSQEKQYSDEVAAAEAQYGPMFAAFGALEITELDSFMFRSFPNSNPMAFAWPRPGRWFWPSTLRSR